MNIGERAASYMEALEGRGVSLSREGQENAQRFIDSFAIEDIRGEETATDTILSDGYDENVELFGLTNDRVHLTIDAYLQRIPLAWKEKWLGKEISTADWKPPQGHAHELSDQLIDFILSSIPQFDKLIANEDFYLYLEQARRWYEETKDIEITDLEQDVAYHHGRKELDRMGENSFYALRRYVKIREDGWAEGRKWGDSAGCPQALLCFWIDRGNNISLLKGRQAAITSTVMAVMCVMMLVFNSWTGVLLTDDKVKTGEDLFDKKVQGTLKLFPEWITQDYTWDRQSKDNVTLDFREDNTKGSRRQNYSDFLLLSSDDSQAVNSKSPRFTTYDEAQNIANAIKIRDEVNPTQFTERDGKLLMLRQQLMWGTGTSNPVGKGIWLNDWKNLYKALLKGEKTKGWIVLFFDWTCRPGADKEWYMGERADAIRKYRAGDRNALNIFASGCPNAPEDAFMESHATIVPAVVIKRNRDWLGNQPDELRPVKGIFRPIYSTDPKDATKKDGNADHPFKIVGSRFVPARTTLEMMRAPVDMFLPPSNDWLDRNFMGTDPIQSATGRSQFSSTVYDKVGLYFDGKHGTCCGTEHPHFHPTLACLLNGRTGNVKDMYTQSALMALAYRNHGQVACRHLVEWNQGQSFIEYLQQDWIDQRKSLVTRMELPERYQVGNKTGNLNYGFHMTADTKGKMLTDVEDMVYGMNRNIRFPIIWDQLADVELEEKDGRKTWGTKDPEKGNDDTIISSVLSKICAETCTRKPIRYNSFEAPTTRTRKVLRKVPNAMGGMQLVQVEETYQPKYRRR